MKFIATAVGDFGGKVHHPGGTFEGPDTMEGSWFRPASDIKGQSAEAAIRARAEAEVHAEFNQFWKDKIEARVRDLTVAAAEAAAAEIQPTALAKAQRAEIATATAVAEAGVGTGEGHKTKAKAKAADDMT